MKCKVLVVLFVIMIFIFGLGITYSIFNSNSNLNSVDQNVAKFIFNTEKLNKIYLPVIDLKPGDSQKYDFIVSNNYNGKSSDVTIEYQITIKTYHFIPVVIELYNMDKAELILTCDESYTRNEKNELVCNTEVQSMNHTNEDITNYQLKIIFPSEYNDRIFSELTDYINIEINSWQKLLN